MDKVDLEKLLGIYYQQMYEEYLKYDTKHLMGIYDHYVSKEVREKIINGELLEFTTKSVVPERWNAEIILYVNLYTTFEFYLLSVVDLTEHVSVLVKDEHFKILVFLMFYIKNHIKPIECNLRTISH